MKEGGIIASDDIDSGFPEGERAWRDFTREVKLCGMLQYQGLGLAKI